MQLNSANNLPENEYDNKLVRCFSNGIVKCLGGLSIGLLTTVILAKWRTWPMWLGTGVGLGIAYSDCDYDYRKGTVIRGKLIKKKPDGGTETNRVIVVDVDGPVYR